MLSCYLKEFLHSLLKLQVILFRVFPSYFSATVYAFVYVSVKKQFFISFCCFLPSIKVCPSNSSALFVLCYSFVKFLIVVISICLVIWKSFSVIGIFWLKFLFISSICSNGTFQSVIIVEISICLVISKSFFVSFLFDFRHQSKSLLSLSL